MKKLLDYSFEFVGYISPVLDNENKISEYYPQGDYTNEKGLSLNKFGAGAFCNFSIDTKWSGFSGVYAFYVDEELVYIGQCSDLVKRMNAGYGNISPRNCYEGGQSTNCKINRMVLNSAKSGKVIRLFFLKTQSIEGELIKHYNPKHNVMLSGGKANVEEEMTRPDTITKNPSIHEVRDYIQELLLKARRKGATEHIVLSGDIHRELKMSNALPTVCSAMRTLELPYRYETLETPPKGNGTRLKFRYILSC